MSPTPERPTKPTLATARLRLRPVTPRDAADIDCALDKLAASRVVATALVSNAGSIRVMRKLGMTMLGEWVYKGTMAAVAYSLSPPTRGVVRDVPG
jgi:RimJ/RimL family protein N-acetyltransferase